MQQSEGFSFVPNADGSGERKVDQGPAVVNHIGQNKMNVLVFILLTEFILCVGFFINHGWAPLILARSAPQAERHPYVSKSDPHIGQSAPALLILADDGHEKDLARPTGRIRLVVFLTGCRTCTLPYLKELQAFQDAVPSVEVTAIAPDNTHSINAFLASNHLKINVYAEYASDGPDRYNVAWRPRVYAISPKGTLIYCQPASDKFHTALSNVAKCSNARW